MPERVRTIAYGFSEKTEKGKMWAAGTSHAQVRGDLVTQPKLKVRPVLRAQGIRCCPSPQVPPSQ